MTDREQLELRWITLELEANGVMSAISRWEESTNEFLKSETILSLQVQARILLARASGIREYLDGEKEDD